VSVFKDSIKAFFEGFLDIIFPRDCALCGKPAQLGVCKECESNLAEFDHAYCPVCERALLPKEPFCTQHRDYPLSFVRPLAPFDEMYRELIHAVKYSNGVDVAKFLGVKIGELISSEPIFDEYDVLVPVPLHRNRLLDRGYNQAEIIAVEAAKVCGKKVIKCVVRTRETLSQTKLSAVYRKINVKGAFKVVRSSAIRGKGVMIVDDVVTTGATSSEVAKVLKYAGATRVCVVCIAHPCLDDSRFYKV